MDYVGLVWLTDTYLTYYNQYILIMKSEIKLTSENGESVTELIAVQSGGRVTIVDALRALEIPEDKWKDTYLQAHLMLLPNQE